MTLVIFKVIPYCQPFQTQFFVRTVVSGGRLVQEWVDNTYGAWGVYSPQLGVKSGEGAMIIPPPFENNIFLLKRHVWACLGVF